MTPYPGVEPGTPSLGKTGLHPAGKGNPLGRYCPFYRRVISTVLHFSASSGQTEDEGIEPLQVLPVPQLSRLVAIHLAASSLRPLY